MANKYDEIDWWNTEERIDMINTGIEMISYFMLHIKTNDELIKLNKKNKKLKEENEEIKNNVRMRTYDMSVIIDRMVRDELKKEKKYDLCPYLSKTLDTLIKNITIISK